MDDAGATLRSAGVKAIYLAHGTFVGPDALGVLGELARLYPSAGLAVRRVIRRVFEELRGDGGTFTESYAQAFESAIHRAGQREIPVELFHWSGENHHIGRADGAVRLIHELSSLECEPGERILLWGHSHAGNVFALATNLLARDLDTVERFFDAAGIYYRLPVFGWIDIPLWNRVRDMLLRGDAAVANLQLDFVTFGTPIRYGWDSAGYASLLHFIHRRCADGPECRAGFPVRLDSVLGAEEGDYVQQLAIAGTNVVPSLFAWRAYLADRRLHALLETDGPPSESLDRFRAGTIVPDEGTTLLVDYGCPEGGIGEHLAGHAVYTGKQWLLFHAQEVARRLYVARACKAA
ncbi:MAG: hypothetical protein HUU20_16340 [Pirellulales bacterium]|nr:hypothetical protein [Pirellulales bacterium]